MSEQPYDTSARLVCPTCYGGKVCQGFINRGDDGCDWGMFPCLTCKGEGVVTREKKEAIEEGRKHYEERVARHESLRDCAARLGITPRELSQWEHGRDPKLVAPPEARHE